MEKESKIEFELEFEKIVAEIKYLLKYNPKSEEQIKKKMNFLKKYFEKNIINMLTMKNVNLLVQEDCVIEKQKKDMNVLYVIVHVAIFVIKIITIVKNAFFSDDDSDFKYYLKIYFNENYYNQD
ncbi:hypothetical protein C6B38_06715 [Spiroplasma sp. ChiS]|uniref:hypothetical protein n=1 Tax=Spiroplasma sp. ChiS TaxID=2099885 RepID=UPI000CF91834|nr:hypothetical protein [Spiroplasma sp. ChiS]PQP78382.1 hypothetical protein C6B38_06715 [Spiroplasma sp. ChiS]